MTNNENKVKEPLFHITKRAAMPWKKAWGIRLIAIFASLIFCGLLSLIVIGANPIDFYSALLKGSLGSTRSALHFSCRNAGFQNEILEYRCRRANSDGSSRDSRMYVLSRR